jgi:hypothetical protein
MKGFNYLAPEGFYDAVEAALNGPSSMAMLIEGSTG